MARAVQALVRAAGCLLLLTVAACAGRQAATGQNPDGPAPAGFKAVLIAGDASLPVFDNATGALAARLVGRGVPSANVQRLSASPFLIQPAPAMTATLSRVEAAIDGLNPASGQGCLVFATSHGAAGRGLYLSPYQEFLTPGALDASLARGCGAAPTVVIVSGCYTGAFAEPPMARPNRVVLTAARADRPSFGCGAGRDFTFYDECLLAATEGAATWREVNERTKACVTRQEAGSGFPPSEPQAYFGRQVGDLALPN